MKTQHLSKLPLLAFGGLCALLSLTACQTLNETKQVSTQNGALLHEIRQDQVQVLPAITSLRSDLAEQAQANEKALTMCLNSLDKATEQNSVMVAALNSCHEENKTTKSRPVMHVATPSTPAQDPLKLADGKMIFGEAEWIYIAEAEVSFDSRIDSGASVSSINAINIQKFERDGRKWYSFDIPINTSHLLHLEAPLVRTTDIKKASGDGETEKRPVVKLTVKIGGYTAQAEFTLKDRTTMQYPVLIGREFIKDIAIVDVSRIHVQPKIKDASSVGSLKVKRDGTKIPNSQEIKMAKKEREENIPAKLKTDDTKQAITSTKNQEAKAPEKDETVAPKTEAKKVEAKDSKDSNSNKESAKKDTTSKKEATTSKTDTVKDATTKNPATKNAVEVAAPALSPVGAAFDTSNAKD